MAWINYIPNYRSFSYEFNVPVTVENFKEIILKFDSCFLLAGEKYGIFYFESSLNNAYSALIEKYVKARQKEFNSNNSGFLKLLDLNQSAELFQSDSLVLIPVENIAGDGIELNSVENSIIEIDWPLVLEYSPILEGYYWEDELSVKISSNSNIWFDTIDKIKIENEPGYTLLDTPLNNMLIASNITSRFNMFLKELRIVVEELGGKVVLRQEHHENVTERGIIVGGKLLYKELVDE